MNVRLSKPSFGVGFIGALLVVAGSALSQESVTETDPQSESGLDYYCQGGVVVGGWSGRTKPGSAVGYAVAGFVLSLRSRTKPATATHSEAELDPPPRTPLAALTPHRTVLLYPAYDPRRRSAMITAQTLRALMRHLESQVELVDDGAHRQAVGRAPQKMADKISFRR